MKSVTYIKHNLADLGVVSIVIVYEVNVFSIDVFLSKIVNFPVEEVLEAQVTAGQMLDVISQVLWLSIVILRI